MLDGLIASGGGAVLVPESTVVPHKEHDLLLEALSGIASPPWRCTFVGSLDRDPRFVERLRRRSADTGTADRIRFTGPRTGEQLRRCYQAADVLVLPSRFEAYGLVVTEALGFGLPVIAASVGGVPEALGTTDHGPPGVLVPPDDPDALGEAIGTRSRDPLLRARLRRTARERRDALEGWEGTARHVAEALVAAGSRPGPVVTPRQPDEP